MTNSKLSAVGEQPILDGLQQLKKSMHFVLSAECSAHLHECMHVRVHMQLVCDAVYACFCFSIGAPMPLSGQHPPWRALNTVTIL
jgi:hypothetical protein